MKKISTMILVMLAAAASLTKAQNMTPYQFINTTGTYTDLTSPILLSSTAAWDDEIYTVPLGFNFQYINQTFDTAYVNTYGYIAFDPSEEIIFAGFLTDLADRAYNTTGNSVSPVSYKVMGSPGSRSFVVEFKNTGFYSDMSGTDYVNLQIWLNEADNSAELRMGPSSVQTPATAYGGETGPMVGVAQIDPNFTSVIYSLVLEGSPSSPTTTALNLNTLNFLNGTPSNGQIYRFVPNGVGAPEHDNNTAISVYPNPLTEASVIEARIAESTLVNISIIDVSGRTIAELANTQLSAGRHAFNINRAGLAPGIYFAKVIAGNNATLHKIIVAE